MAKNYELTIGHRNIMGAYCPITLIVSNMGSAQYTYGHSYEDGGEGNNGRKGGKWELGKLCNGDYVKLGRYRTKADAVAVASYYVENEKKEQAALRGLA